MSTVTASTSSGEASIRPGWQAATIALLLGLLTMSVFVFLVAIVQPPGLAVPTGLAPIFAFVATTGAIGLPLLWWNHGAGYAIAMLAGVLDVIGIARYLSGALGPASASPGSLAYGILGSLVVMVSLVAWRQHRSSAGNDSPSANSF